MWRHVAVIGLGIAALGGSALAQTAGGTLGVADLVEMAAQRNRDFLAAKERVAEMQGLLRQAGVRPAPALEVENTTGRPLGSPGEHVLSAGYFHTIETFGKREKRQAVARKSAEAAEADVADRLRLLTLEVKLKYAAAVREQQKLEAMRRLASANRAFYDLTDARVQRGDAAPLEGQLFLTELSRVDAQQVILTSGAERAVLALRRAVGLPAAEPLVLASPPPQMATSALPELQARALRDRPDVRALRVLEEEALAEEALVRADGKPDITASARYSRVDGGFDQRAYDQGGRLVPITARDHMLTVGISFLLFPPVRNRGALEAALARSAAARLRREHLESAVRLEVEAAYLRWRATATAVDILSRGVIGPSERNLAVIRQAHTLGQLRVLDVLNEQRRLIDTQLAYLDAQSDLFEAFSELEASVGGSIQ